MIVKRYDGTLVEVSVTEKATHFDFVKKAAPNLMRAAGFKLDNGWWVRGVEEKNAN